MHFDLPYTPPYDWSTARRLVAAHAVPDAERLGADGTITRLITVGDAPVLVTVGAGPESIMVSCPDGTDEEPLQATLRHWLDVDLDPARVQAALSVDPTIGPLITANPGLRRIGYPHAFEAVILTVLGQQVSLAAGRTFAGRLVRAYGRPGPADLMIFPTADRLAAIPHQELQTTVGLTGARTRTVQAVSTAFAADPLLVVAGAQSAHQRDTAASRLLALPGIGPWTTDYLRMRLLADPDAVPAGDLVLRKALGGMTARQVTAAAEAWRPCRTYAVLHLWSTMAWA